MLPPERHAVALKEHTSRSVGPSSVPMRPGAARRQTRDRPHPCSQRAGAVGHPLRPGWQGVQDRVPI
eukprot:179775-Chlamydomonas_euryale.AAC.1